MIKALKKIGNRMMDGMTLLHIACRDGDEKIVRKLVQKKNTDVEIKDNRGNTPLHYASQNGHTELVRYLAAKRDANAESQNNKGETPLHLASLWNHLDTVRYLVEVQNVNVEPQTNIRNETPLHYACQKGNIDVIHFLVGEAGTSIESPPNNDGLTPFQLAEKARQEEVVECFNPDRLPKHHLSAQEIQHQQSTRAVDHLIEAARRGDMKAVQRNWDFLKGKNRTGTANFKDSTTPLHMACLHGHMQIVQFLVEEDKMKIDAKNEFGATPLHYACRKGHLPIVKHLIKNHKQDLPTLLEGLTNGDETAVMVGQSHGHKDVVAYLVDQCGAKPDVSAASKKDNKIEEQHPESCRRGLADDGVTAPDSSTSERSAQEQRAALLSSSSSSPLVYWENQYPKKTGQKDLGGVENSYMNVNTAIVNIIGCTGNEADLQ